MSFLSEIAKIFQPWLRPLCDHSAHVAVKEPIAEAAKKFNAESAKNTNVRELPRRNRDKFRDMRRNPLNEKYSVPLSVLRASVLNFTYPAYLFKESPH
jgi:hypothetical protein